MSSTAPPPSDSAIINPHNPEFLTKKPWYLTDQQQAASEEPTLDHQTKLPDPKEELASLTAHEERLAKQRQEEKEANSIQKGMWIEAKKNNKLPYRICQVVTVHKKKNLLDLKYEDGSIEKRVKASNNRVRLTKSGNRSQTTAEHESFDSKRDAYHGYDRDGHNAKVVAKFEKREAIRRELREKNKAEGQEEGGDAEKAAESDFGDSDSEDGNDKMDEFVQRDDDAKVITTRLARQGGVGGAQMKVTARNLRIREDTAKYLRNLDPNSAYYDPKSRSMRDNPHPELNAEQTDFVGDNFARVTGDAVELADTQVFAWDAARNMGNETVLHPQANPSQAELLKRQFRSDQQGVKIAQKNKVLSKYGGEEYLDGKDGLGSVLEKKVQGTGEGSSDRATRFGVSTQIQDFSSNAKQEPVKQRYEAIPSKYQEDVFTNGHTTVWGSYFHKGAFTWGYADDHSLMRQSYCTGATGRQANDEAHALQYGTGEAGSAELAQARQLLQPKKSSSSTSANTTSKPTQRSKLYGEADPNAQLDADKVQAAMKKAAEESKDDASKKRKYHSIEAEVEMTEEDMEAYRLRKGRSEDPMAKLTDCAGVLDYKK